MLKVLLILFSLFLLSGCATKELQKEVVYLDKECAKPSLDMSEFSAPKTVKIAVFKGSFSVSIKNDDYLKMKETNQDIKDRYVKLREWVITNVGLGLIKNEVAKE